MMKIATSHNLLLFLALCRIMNPSMMLICPSTVCNKGNLCEETCSEPDQSCLGTYYVTNGTIVTLMLKCYKSPRGQCDATICYIAGTFSSFAACCCISDYCTKHPVIVNRSQSSTSLPTESPPTPQTLYPLSMSVDHLTCEFGQIYYNVIHYS